MQERYSVLYVRPSRIHRRRFDPKGNEIEPNFSNTRKVNTGFLMSSFKVEAKGDTDQLSLEELMGLVNKPELVQVTGRHTPSQTVAFWLPEAEMKKMELELGTEIRLKTRGDSPFVFSLAKLDAGTVTKCNFVGDSQVGASWTDNILAKKPQGRAAAEPCGQGDGAEDDEWGRTVEGAESLGLVVLGVGGVACAAVQLPFHPDCPSPPAQVFVETLDKCFENVCELDLIFHMDKVHYILQEVVMGGMVLETNMNEIVAQINAQSKLEKSEGGLSAAPARAVSAVKNINLPELPRNINIGDINIKVPSLSPFV
ncbi:arpin-like [Alligator sinensis]|uniref:Arpin n=1 Tax=Alligator sinensis TaxID=38654 RepID=A0A1U7S847_ALLSI|nr:arpin-like [Alligator sinensis]